VQQLPEDGRELSVVDDADDLLPDLLDGQASSILRNKKPTEAWSVEKGGCRSSWVLWLENHFVAPAAVWIVPLS
jgi:hypothetical protein